MTVRALVETRNLDEGPLVRLSYLSDRFRQGCFALGPMGVQPRAFSASVTSRVLHPEPFGPCEPAGPTNVTGHQQKAVPVLSTPGTSALKVSEGDRFVTVRTHPAGSNTSAEDIAIWTSANTEVAALTARTLIHDLNASGTGLRAWSTRTLASPIGRLATAIRVKLASARGLEGKATPGTGDNTHIVTLS